MPCKYIFYQQVSLIFFRQEASKSVGRLRGLKDKRLGIISERVGRLEGKSLSDHQMGWVMMAIKDAFLYHPKLNVFFIFSTSSKPILLNRSSYF